MKKIILCHEGISKNVDEWSNIPYMLHTTLVSKGVQVIDFNTSSNVIIKQIWRYSFGFVHKIINKNTSYDFYRSSVNNFFTIRKLDKVVEKYNNEEVALVNLSISHSPTKSKIPVILLSDWSYDHYIEHFLNRKPDWSENKTILRDRQSMERADLNLLLFPLSCKRLKKQIKKANFDYISHVVNVHPEAALPTFIDKEFNRRNLKEIRLVFIGRAKYKHGLIVLNELIKINNNKYKIFVDVIGIDKHEATEFIKNNDKIEFHGYLSKQDKKSRDKYYTILNNSDVMLNLTENWGPFSATLEAMYYYTMIITPKYDEFTEVFGVQANFAEYIEEVQAKKIFYIIERLINNPDELYLKKINAKEASEKHLWSNFVDKLLEMTNIIYNDKRKYNDFI
jgi:hypothetical protein